MRVISFSMIRDFIAKHADADVPLRDWYKRVTNADWNTFADMKQTFNRYKGQQLSGSGNCIVRQQEGLYAVRRHS